MSNEVFEAVRTVLAVREFQDKAVPDDVLRRVVEAGHLSASASNKQPWQFVLVKDKKALHELGSLVRTGPYIASAAAAVVVAVDKANPLAVSDASRAIQSMILTAWADGVGSNWAGFGGLEAVRHKVGLPDQYDVIAVLPLGYPKRSIGKGRKNRRPFDEVVSSERFGTPLS
jgi:nitroreductase